jgi:hypothetical protein
MEVGVTLADICTVSPDAGGPSYHCTCGENQHRHYVLLALSTSIPAWIQGVQCCRAGCSGVLLAPAAASGSGDKDAAPPDWLCCECGAQQVGVVAQAALAAGVQPAA